MVRMNVARLIEPASRHEGRTRDAWSIFWQEPGQSRCAAGAAGIWRELSAHWSGFAASLADGTRVLDLGCGAGAVARELLAARTGLELTGIDFARIPFTLQPRLDLLSETPMESLPFADGSFGAAVSQFGIEYARIDEAVGEAARVLATGARLSLLVHHAESAIVGHNRARLNALSTFLGSGTRSAFCGGDALGFHAQMSALLLEHPSDALVAELARSLPSRLARASRERQALWQAVDDALAPEHCLAEALAGCCVAPAAMPQWLEPLRRHFRVEPVSVLHDAGGDPVAWCIQAVKDPADQAASAS
jgi:SAM-dependent methyltransferase